MHTTFKYLFAVLFLTFALVLPVHAAEEVTYLLTAASKGDVATVNAMLASGANANAKDEDGFVGDDCTVFPVC